MRAARFHGRGDIRIDEVPDPGAGAGQVLVAVDWCGICGTDLHEFLEGPIFIPGPGAPHPITGETLPVVMGHEFAGTIAERCAVDARWVHPLGDLGTDIGALVEPLAVGYHAVRLSGMAPGGTAVVFGAGPIGLVTIASLHAAGAGRVISVEPATARKAKAPGAGADTVLDPTEVDVPAAVRELTGGAGADVAFECAGIDTVLASAIGSVRPGGTVVNVAIWGHPATVQMNDLVLSEVNVIGSLAYCGDHPDTIGLLQSGTVDAGQFITARIGLDELVDGGFRELIENKNSHVKILVQP